MWLEPRPESIFLFTFDILERHEKSCKVCLKRKGQKEKGKDGANFLWELETTNQLPFLLSSCPKYLYRTFYGPTVVVSG
jgi:hypothetical protein